MSTLFSTIIFGTTISALWLVIIALGWLFIAIWPAMMAKTKGYSFMIFFILSMFAWWLMFFVVFFLPNRNTQPPTTA